MSVETAYQYLFLGALIILGILLPEPSGTDCRQLSAIFCSPLKLRHRHTDLSFQ